MTRPIDRGDVREALIRAGTDMLDEPGNTPLTLRGIAARAGVSHGAPAHHFNGLPGLRVAIAIRGFNAFFTALSAARNGISGSHEDVLTGVCQAYIHFAETRRGLFRLMFDELAAPTPELGEAATRSYMLLRELCHPFTDDEDPRLETTIWAMTHGYAALELGRARAPSAPFQPPDYEDLLRRILARHGREGK